jgi:preprotein translocase subunit SecF
MPRIYPIVFVISLILVVLAAGALLKFGLNFGVDFTGGSVLEVTFANGRPPVADVQAFFAGSDDELQRTLSLTPAGEKNLILRSADRTNQMGGNVLAALQEQYSGAGVAQLRFDFIGPAIGSELRAKAERAIILVLASIVLYIAWVFRAMRRVLPYWAMGAAALVALAHDLIIPLGIFALLGTYGGVQIGAVFVAAVLTILGYSVSDTVVVFDRVRENVIRGMPGSFGAVVHVSVLQTLTRSLNTTMTTLLSLIAIWFFGGESIRYFALALILGIGLGAYSSIFVASPLLVWLSRWRGVKR